MAIAFAALVGVGGLKLAGPGDPGAPVAPVAGPAWTGLVDYMAGRAASLTPEASALARAVRLGRCTATCAVYPASGTFSFRTLGGERVNAPAVYVNPTTMAFTTSANGAGAPVDATSIALASELVLDDVGRRPATRSSGAPPAAAPRGRR